MNTEKFLQFNGKNLLFLAKDGTYWVAIKPICEAIGVNYDRQYKNLKSDTILSKLYAKQHTVGADKKLRNMICLPEKYIYGWLFSINSESKELQEYKKECYNILYNHFHGIMTNRKELLLQRKQLKQKIKAYKTENEAFARLKELDKERKSIEKQLQQSDDTLMNQLSLFDLKKTQPNHPIYK